ncbi:MAG: hypothetical protein IT429_14930 [Gemmataceae bacterium]|nr:hypothetical protein [Gemmataceae bacterium]
MVDNRRGRAGEDSYQLTASDRKLRLFACAVARRAVPAGATDWKVSRITWEDIATAERCAEGLATADDLTQARIASDLWCCDRNAVRAAEESARILRPAESAALLRDVFGNPWRPVEIGTPVAVLPGGLVSKWKRWPPWYNSTVVGLARAAYEERAAGGILDSARLAVLADALEEEGCTEEAVLRHLRGEESSGDALGTFRICEARQCGKAFHERDRLPLGKCPHCGSDRYHKARGWMPSRGPHVRGCWVLDLLLGRD